VRSGDGGGYGNPFERDPELVRLDVVCGYVSREAARRDYGVVLRPDTLAIDVEETQRLRAEAGS
jgi:N-methylhydantoinase B